MSLNVKVKSQRSRSPGAKNALCTHNTPRCGRNGTPSLQITSRKQQTRRFDRCRGVSSPGCLRWAWRATAGLCHAFLVVNVVKLWLNSPRIRNLTGVSLVFIRLVIFYSVVHDTRCAMWLLCVIRVPVSADVVCTLGASCSGLLFRGGVFAVSLVFWFLFRPLVVSRCSVISRPIALLGIIRWYFWSM